ncbi:MULTISPECIES: sulfate ABC transporter permease subunit CysW [unclassified Shinella]|jgi:sulfate transport system permease protein|uniref:sulfate ABC transporter permease subunit CysW n=1 Tax=unclassified Shinella TaxID=2643062 RepID=UPI0003C545E0|nr:MULTISPECIES: sulfate ABC transporter permease subunit CysW [unclassified Shinella]MCA0344120.1 sulfate ABC transporter permease subunit CysW [Pseudomonadota bacterium]EYR79769.1 sulfate transport system permease protein CysW [Shinella sp. DD12]MCO5152264.1 sulfate ABC transporter permease subunit CysW [Shinella sp.]MDC7263659.1 sulfate ABC transporter permease subunit CysW [Shinella sp. HY16]MDC7270554.1 sulfate ABC transporter permease subunit CysW [Shinella sp. YZ44]
MVHPGKGTPPRVGDNPVFRRSLLAFVLVLVALMIVAPLVVIAVEAFSRGVGYFAASIADPDTRHAILLTVVTALIAVPINTAFGVAAAWAITKHDFRGKRLLTVVIELPFSVSPIVAGVSYLFVYGLQGLFGPALQSMEIKILFALPGIVLASMFVTAPFVARELIPLMQAQGRDLEEAATSLGASGWRTFFSVTLPNIKWALLYGVVLCNSRVMGEFGAVSVVSGNIRGQTNTLPLHIELLYHDYNAAGSFAAASILAGLAIVTLVAKVALERQGAGRVQRPSQLAGADSITPEVKP